MYAISKISGYIISGYPYFSILYLIVCWKKIKSDEFYKEILSISNLTCVVLSFPAILIIIEIFTSWYSGNMFEQYAFAGRAVGYFGLPFYFLFGLVNIIFPQIFWFKRIRKSLISTVVFSVIILLPGLFELLVPIITSFHKDYLPSAWVCAEPWYVRILLTPFMQMISYACCVFAVFYIKVKSKK